MSEGPEGLMVVEIAQDRALVWTAGVEPGSVPTVLRPPAERARHEHLRKAQREFGREQDHQDPAFYESISKAVENASAIILVGHGKGKANAMLHLVQYWERHHPAIAANVTGAIDSDLEALSDKQVLALVRDWFEEYDSSR